MKNAKLIVPEGSYSPNYLCVIIENLDIAIKEQIDLPKLITSIKENLQIIDNKIVYNSKPFYPDLFYHSPFLTLEIVGLNLTGYFYINKIKEDFAKIMRIKVNIRSPKVESKIYLSILFPV